MKTQIHVLFLLVSFVCFSQSLSLEKIKCRVSENDIEAIEKMIEFQSYYYKPLFNSELETIKIKLFGKEKTYKKVRDSMTNLGVHKSPAYYSGRTKTIYLYKSDNYISTLYHEINHAIIHQVIKGRIPTWINEGMSEFFESFTFIETRLLMRLQSRRLNDTRRWIIEKKVNLRDLLNYSHSEWYKKNLNPSSYSYSVSYAFVCYLYLKDPEYISVILESIKEGKNSIEAVEFAMNQDIDFIENDFDIYMKEYYLKGLMKLKYSRP